MSETASLPVVDLSDLYTSLCLASPVGVAISGKRQEISLAEVDRQCREIDELWCELGHCIHHWHDYPVEFIATRFANLHYVGVVNKVDSAKPPEAVWQYLVEKITQQVYGKVVVMRHREYTPGRVFAWR